MKIVVNGVSGLDQTPGLEPAMALAEVTFAGDAAALAESLPGTEILLGWDFRGNELEECWAHADALKWIHWCGAGVDAVLFPALIESNVVLTNSRGLFDRPMAEYVLALILAQAKGLPLTLEKQKECIWSYRFSERVDTKRVVIVGVGSIAREIARLLQAVGFDVSGVGRTERDGVPVFGHVRGEADLLNEVSTADWVVAILPGLASTRGKFDDKFFRAMKPSGRFINLGRGISVDEEALRHALDEGQIAGAALDVFQSEPLPHESPLWDTPNLIISPHMSGDYEGYFEDLSRLFLENLAHYRGNKRLLNIVDKQAGYVRD